MIVLAIADRAPRESIISIVNKYSIELICTLGDLDYFSLVELKDIHDIPKIGVYGNHCSGSYFDELGIKNMHLSTFEYKGLVFGGFEGSVRYKDDKYAPMYTQDEAFTLLHDFPKVDIMLTHCPPYKINDEPEDIAHQGFKALRSYLEEERPNIFYMGIHIQRTKSLLQSMKIQKLFMCFQIEL